MKFKLVPAAPDDLSFVADAQRAIPLVPASEDDCCARLMRRLDLPSRDVARTWLTFLRALELAEETPSGFKRLRVDPTEAHLREAFQRRVFGAEAVIETLGAADGPLAAEDVFDRFEAHVPVWEQHKNPQTWEALWTERVGDILQWLALLGAAAPSDGGYVAATS